MLIYAYGNWYMNSLFSSVILTVFFERERCGHLPFTRRVILVKPIFIYATDTDSKQLKGFAIFLELLHVDVMVEQFLGADLIEV